MIPTTMFGLVILICAVLPGAVLIWGYERQAGSFGVSAGDRVLRFIGASAIVHAVAAPGEYWIYRNVDGPVTWPGFWLLWGAAVTVVTACAWVGSGPDPAPRAWDALFSERPDVYLRIRLTDESWVAGQFAEDSYAGGHPHARPPPRAGVGDRSRERSAGYSLARLSALPSRRAHPVDRGGAARRGIGGAAS